ncbi:MAG: beta-lactamase family protein, partial [Gammaproteobacteria bacterium]|nr:beta-lactamase family protein [Gammaproteobacteria bacterium]
MRMRTWLAALSAFSAIAVCGAEIPDAEPESVGMSTERLLRIDAAMTRHIEAGNIQGAVTAVARRGKVVHFKAHGMMDVEAGRPMSEDAIFIMMSSTKPILGVAAMMMIEEGLIRPNDPVSKYIPEFADMQVAVLKEPADEDISPFRIDRRNPPQHRLVPAETPVTIKHLLTHTSGLASGGLGTAQSRPAERVTLASYIPTLGAAVLDFQPGSRWTYSGGTGLDVVARIIEIVSGTPYDEFVQTRIFDPLDMTDTHYNVPPPKASRRVVIQGRDISRWSRDTTYFSGSYGLSSTARDYLHFEQMLANGGELFGHRLLGSRSVEWMASNHLGNLYRGFTQTARGQGFGYTVAVVLDPVAADSRRSAGAFGWGGAFGTRSWTDP